MVSKLNLLKYISRNFEYFSLYLSSVFGENSVLLLQFISTANVMLFMPLFFSFFLQTWQRKKACFTNQKLHFWNSRTVGGSVQMYTQCRWLIIFFFFNKFVVVHEVKLSPILLFLKPVNSSSLLLIPTFNACIFYD